MAEPTVDQGSGRAPIRVVPLIAGLAFVTLGLVGLVDLDSDAAAWIWVLGLTALAIGGLISTIRR